MSTSCGRVSLVGAGCGRADLITLRGARRLRACTALVYDDLIDPGLLELAPPEAERHAMGKRAGRHSAPQEEISQLLIRLARAGHRVVRLKGGDPFVFGRGGEEALALAAAGIPCEMIPGISSALAIPAEAGIPVTHRGLSQSVHIVTAHTADTPEGLPAGLETLARLPGTLVFLMGLSRLPLLLARLQAAGMDPATPAAVLSGGNAPHPMAVRGTVGTLARLAQAAGVQPPAVIVTGPVAALNLPTAFSLPLSGVRVGVTGTDAFAAKLTAALEDRGAAVFRAQRFQVEPLEPDLSFLTARRAPWLVFTSANGVDCFFHRLRAQRVDLRQLSRCRLAVIGPATGARLEERGLYPDLCPETHTTRALGTLLLEQLPAGAEVVLLRSQAGDPELRERLTARFSVTDCPLYAVRSERPEGTREKLDYLVFASAGGVRAFLDQGGEISPETVCVCIGPVTAQALTPRWQGAVLIAPTPSVDAVTAALESDAAQRLTTRKN